MIIWLLDVHTDAGLINKAVGMDFQYTRVQIFCGFNCSIANKLDKELIMSNAKSTKQ